MTTAPRARTDWQKAVDMRISDHATRLSQIEQNQAVYIALSDERRKVMDERFTRVDSSIAATERALGDEIRTLKSIIARLNWIIITTFASAIVGSVVVDKFGLFH